MVRLRKRARRWDQGADPRLQEDRGPRRSDRLRRAVPREFRARREAAPERECGKRPAQQEVEATYSYHDASSQVAFEVVRFVFKQVGGGYVTDVRGKRMKTFRLRRPSGESDQSWLWSLEAGEFMRPA